jgi:ankyrin repeat protein
LNKTVAKDKVMSHRNHQLLKEARKGHVERITRLLDLGADVNFRGKYGYTPLMEATTRNMANVVERICKVDQARTQSRAKVTAEQNC